MIEFVYGHRRLRPFVVTAAVLVLFLPIFLVGRYPPHAWTVVLAVATAVVLGTLSVRE
jgi:hypothetical protein